MNNNLTYYSIAHAFGFDMIEFALNRYLDQDGKTITLKFGAFNKEHIELRVSNSNPEIKDGWGKLYTKLNGEFLPIEKLRKRDVYGDVALYLTVYENQVDELNSQLEQKLADFNKAETESRKEMDEKHDKAYEIYQEIESTIAGYERTHPLTGSPKQIAWANQIRESAFTSVVFDDPDNAEMRIRRTLDNPERQKAKFWIDNRKSFGY